MSFDRIPAHGYYLKNGQFYSNAASEDVQDESQKAYELGTNLIKENERAYSTIKTHHYNLTFSISDHDPFGNMWFWLYMSNHSHHHSGSSGCGGCCGSGGGSGGNGGKDCAVVLLVIAIVALVAAAVVAIGFTGYQGYEAREVRKEIETLKKESKLAQQEKVQEVYNKMVSIRNEEWRNKSLQTLFTATLVVGLGLLTASAILALYAVKLELPMSPLTQTFAIAGGAVVGGGIIGHLTTFGVQERRKRATLEKYEDLHESIRNLDHFVNPITVLNSICRHNALLYDGNYTYIKKGNSYSRAQEDPENPKSKYSFNPYNLPRIPEEALLYPRVTVEVKRP